MSTDHYEAAYDLQTRNLETAMELGQNILLDARVGQTDRAVAASIVEAERAAVEQGNSLAKSYEPSAVEEEHRAHLLLNAAHLVDLLGNA